MRAAFVDHTPPMPYKHTTETLLLFVLAVAIIVTGMLMQTFASVPNGLVPWAIVFVFAVAYPLSLSYSFRRNRADYEFRLLHWVPASMLLLWLALQAILYVWPSFSAMTDWYTWGWSLPAVASAFVLLALFVLKVLRRWTTRLALLALAFFPFMASSIANEYYDWNSQLAATLWQGEWWQVDTSTGTQIAQQTAESSSDKNLAASVDPAEEQYRERLRSIERRRDRIVERLENRGMTEKEASSTAVVAMNSQNSSSDSVRSVASETPMISSSSSLPTALPSSGFGWSAIIVLLLAGYCAAVQRKTIYRRG